MKTCESMNTYEEILEYAQRQLADAGIEDAKIDAWYLMEYAFGIDRAYYFLNKDKSAPAGEKDKYSEYIKKRAMHIPLQHITGTQEFMGLEFKVDENVLVPRQDTENLVEQALPHVKGKKVLDMCTGSGCIAVSVKILGGSVRCDAADISDEALEIACYNAKKNNADITFIKSDMFDNITEKYDVILSNPPYIRPDVIKELMPEVREHEPMLALDGGNDGLDFYRILAEKSKEHLEKDGMIMMEIGYDQGSDVKELFEKNGYLEVKVIKDYSGNDRIVKAHL